MTLNLCCDDADSELITPMVTIGSLSARSSRNQRNHLTITKQISGYTLAEMMITVAIIGILATVAVPNFAKTMELSRYRAAVDVLRTIYAGEKTFFEFSSPQRFADLGSPVDCPEGSWRCIYMDNPTSVPGVSFAVAVDGGGLTFTATATYVTGRTKTVNQLDQWTGTWNP